MTMSAQWIGEHELHEDGFLVCDARWPTLPHVDCIWNLHVRRRGEASALHLQVWEEEESPRAPRTIGIGGKSVQSQLSFPSSLSFSLFWVHSVLIAIQLQ